MAIERTLSIIKPDATRRNLTGKINAKFEDAGLRIVAQKRIKLSAEQAGKFYEVHKDRPFFGELVLDVLHRTENAMTQEHAFKAVELALTAQEQARELTGR